MYRSRVQATPHECALAAEMFNHFCSAGTMKQILALHREICNILDIKPARLPDFYPQLKAKLVSSWQAQAVFKKLDTRANHKVYAKGKACPNTRVLIIGAGPCGLRAAIECQLLGAKVVVMEKRDRMSRNNVLHLWPFVINDLRGLGAKKFFGKFCAGSIDHISIRQLQCILLKVCLLLGVEFHEGVSFEELLEPTAADKENNDVVGWRARVDPAEHPVSDYEFDVLLGADGKRNTLRGFKRKEFRGKLAIAITANFINRHSEQEAAVPEISGVAFIFNQKFFKDLFKETGIDLENIVYYKDDTHYFVMTAKKSSLINKGVILRDYAETSRLLSADNVDRNALLQYAHEAAQFSTKGLLPRMDFALNHYGEPDIALFDFTSMYAAENASMVLERSGHRLLCGLVGDSLLEPFWPTGSGCARGFLSAMDAAWSVRQWGQAPAPHPLVIIAERESIYRLLGQTTPENLQRNLGAYTLEPSSRYPNLNTENVTPHRVTSFYNSDEPLPLDVAAAPRKRARGHLTSEEVPSVSVRRSRKRRSTRPSPQEEQLLAQAEATLRRERERIRSQQDVPNLTKEINEPNLAQDKPTRPLADEEWVPEGRSSRKRRSPFSSKKEEAHMVGGGGGTRPGGSQAISRLVAELASGGKPNAPRANKPQDLLRAVGRIESGDWNVKQIERKIHENKMGRPQPKAAEKVPKWDKEQFLERQNRLGGSGEGAGEERWGELDETLKQLDQKLRDSGRPTLGTQKVAKLADRFVKKAEPEPERPVEPPPGKTWTAAAAATVATSAARCAACGARVFAAESVVADGLQLHRSCFRCAVCRTALRPGSYTMEKNGTRLVCLRHGTSVPDGTLIVERRPAKGNSRLAAETPERIVLDVSDDGAREMDEDEWTDRNFLASETSCAGGLSDEEDSSDEEEYEEAGGESGVSAGEAAEAAEYDGGAGGDGAGDRDDELSDDSFGYDDFSDDSADSSGAESSRLREAREARRREVPPANDAATPYRGTDSSEVESEEESSITESEASSATRVSTDSEFDITYKIPPAITVTEAPIRPAPPPSPPVYRPPPPQPPSEYPLSRTRSAGGIATKRALELKRRYLLGEAVSPSVRRSDSTSNLDNKIESFQSNISQFQKLLNPATPEQTRKPNPIFSLVTNMSEVISNFDRSLAEFTEEPDSLNTIQIDTAVDLSSSLLNTVDYNSVHTSVIEKDLSNRMNGTVIDLDTTKDLIQDTVINLNTTEESVVSNDHIISANSPEWQRDSAIELDTTEEKILCSSAQGVVDSDLIEDPESDNSSAQENTLNELDSESLSDSSSTARGSLPKQAVNISKTGSNQQIPRLEVHNDSGEVILSDSPDVSEWAEEGLDDYPNISRGTKALSGPKNLDNIDSAHVCGKESSFMNEIEYLEFVDDDSEATKSIELPTTLNIPTQCNDKPNSPTKEITTPINNTVSTRISDRPGDISFSTLMSFVVRTPAPVLPEVITPVTNVETFLVSSPITPIADTLTISSPVTPNTGSSPISSPVTPILVDKTSKKEEIKRERENQTELVKRMVLERIGSTNASGRKRRPRVLPSGNFPPPIPPAPVMPAPPARPPPPATLTPSASDPELARVRRQRGIVHTVTEFFNKRLSPRNKWASDTELIMEQRQCASTMSVLAREPLAATVARSCDCVSAGGAPTRKHAKGRAWVTRRL